MVAYEVMSTRIDSNSFDREGLLILEETIYSLGSTANSHRENELIQKKIYQRFTCALVSNIAERDR